MPEKAFNEAEEYRIRAAVNMQDATSVGAIQNLAQGTDVKLNYAEMTCKKYVQPVLMVGVKAVSQIQNLMLAITALLEPNGEISQRVNTMGTPLSMKAPTAASVGIASAEAVPINAKRRYLLLVNTSAASISLGFGAAAVLYSGVTIAANGGSYEMSASQGNLTTAQVRAIASIAASNLAVQEGE